MVGWLRWSVVIVGRVGRGWVVCSQVGMRSLAVIGRIGRRPWWQDRQDRQEALVEKLANTPPPPWPHAPPPFPPCSLGP